MKTLNQPTLFEIEQDQFVDLKRASIWASQYLNKNITITNISYLVQYGRINKYGEIGTPLINIDELKKYYDENDNKQNKNRSDELENFVQFINITPDFIKNLPLTIFEKQLSKQSSRFIESLGIQTVGECFVLFNDLSTIFFPLKDFYSKLFDSCLTCLKSLVQEGFLHPKAIIAGVTLDDLFTSRPNIVIDKLMFLHVFNEFMTHNNLDEEIKQAFSSCSPRDIEIYTLRNIKEHSLQKIADQYGITRERVRQLLKSISRKIQHKLVNQPLLIMQSALLFAKDMGEDLSDEKWHSVLLEKNVVTEKILFDNYDAYELMKALINDEGALPKNITVPENAKLIINSDKTVSIIKSLSTLSSKQKREIQRIVNFTGGIHILDAAKIVGTDRTNTINLLKTLGYEEVIENWFSIKSPNLLMPRNPILTAGLTMIKTCGQLKFETFCDGIRRYISRSYEAISPIPVMKYFLQLAGFSIKDGFISYEGQSKGNLNRSERIFLELIEQKGPVVSFQEIIDRFLAEGYSASTATTRIMGRSPIVQRVDEGFYILRGRNYTFQDLEAAKSRQEIFSKDSEVNYCIDGTIKYKITVNSWASGGVISISHSNQPLPELNEGWDVYVDGLEKGKARGNDSLIWGLGPAFKALDVKNGDRIELTFDARESPKIIVRRIND
jgi:RNA polymerase sigma factor (sigma-70 family)